MAEVIRCSDITQLADLCAGIGDSVACIGVFDGLHRGHGFLIDRTCEQAASSGMRPVIITFDVDPDELFCRETLKKLMTNEKRIAALAATSADAVVVLPFTRDFAALPPESFLDSCIAPFGVKAIHVGSDFRFGARAQGTVEMLAAWGSVHGVSVTGHDLLDADGQAITSSRIRALLAHGRIEEANDLLGHPYAVVGTVLHGRGEGADMGFSTANLSIGDGELAIAEGVYGAHAIVDGVQFKAAVSVGVSPTYVETATANIEVHILDFADDLYGRELEVRFLYWLRPMMRFEGVEELIATVTSNIEWVRANC